MKQSLRLALVVAGLGLFGCSTEPKAVAISAAGGSVQTGTAGDPVSILPAVKVVDEKGNGFGGVAVKFTVASGGGSVTGDSVLTDATGVATVGSWTLGKTVGTNTLIATAEGLTGSPVTFTVAAAAGPPVSMLLTSTDNQTATVGATVTTAPSVKVVDANNNGVSGVQVTFAVTNGAGSVTGAAQTTNSSGIATVGGWTLGIVAGANVLTASATGITSVTSTATGVAGPATQIAVATQPAGAVSGVAMTTQPVVQIRDQYSNIATTSTSNVTASIASGTGTLGGTTTVAAVAGVATFTNLSITGTTAVTLGFAATGLTTATSLSIIPTTTVPQNFTIDALYLNQATQSLTGGVPLVAGRAAFARVFVKAAITATASPTVRIRTFQAGTLFKTYTITAPTTTVPLSTTEGSLTSSWNVLIPAADMVAGLTLLADVDPTNVYTESSEADNSFPVSGTAMTLDIRTVSTFNVTFLPVTQPTVAAGDVTTSNTDTYLEFSNRVYPLATTNVVVHAPFAARYTLSGASYDSTWNFLLADVAAARATEGSTRFYYGVIKPGYTSGGTGLGYIGAPSAIGVEWLGTVQPSTNYRSMTAAHEWGHNFNRRHVDCGGPSNPDLAYPYTTTSVGVYGYDLANGLLRAPATFADFMSYCQPLWISDYTYKAVLTYRAANPGVSTAPGRGLLVWGRIGPNGIVLEPAFEIDAPPSLPSRAGPYSVQATDDAGREMFNLSFEAAEVDHAAGERHFTFVVPLPASGATPATLRLRANGQEMIRRSTTPVTFGGGMSTALASVRVSRAVGQKTRLEWDSGSYPLAMVRDPASGQVLGFARGGQADFGVSKTELDVTFSDGVRSVRRLVRMTPP